MSACNKIRHIVSIRQMFRRWRKKSAPSDVPQGHMAVCVGSTHRRFVVRASYLNHPIFKNLLLLAEEEYGFKNTGPLVIPCDELVFEGILRFLTRSESARFADPDEFRRCCHVDFLAESKPLLNGPIW